MNQGYDVANLVRLTGLPVSLFTAMGLWLFITGIFFMISTFPLLGLAPENIKSLLVVPSVGLFLAVIYVSLYRWIYRKLSARLRTETVNLTWNDLRIPGFPAVISVILGLFIIT